MAESWATRRMRWLYNWFPAYRGTGGRVRYIAADWREVRVELRLGWRTRNYVGTIFGGSLYGAIDPIYMVMLIKILGPEYTVWDKAATIRFVRPGRSALHATFRLTEEEIAALRDEVGREGRAERTWPVELVDAAGTVYASIQKVISVRRRDAA